MDTLEVAALKSAVAAGLIHPKAIAAHLYSYNSLPISWRWERWFKRSTGTGAGLGTAVEPDKELLRSRWVPSGDRYWFAWTRVHRSGWVSSLPRAKLYISPQPDWLPKVVHEVGEICQRLGAERIKIGRTLPSLLRPDKMVAYWTRASEARHAGVALLPSLHDVPGQRVPFTAPIGDSGLLSWGIDPPRRSPMTAGESSSWRALVVKILAEALARGLRGETDRPPWEYALWSAQQNGIHTDTWMPNPHLWERFLA